MQMNNFGWSNPATEPQRRPVTALIYMLWEIKYAVNFQDVQDPLVCEQADAYKKKI